jgi:hypothetical protein
MSSRLPDEQVHLRIEALGQSVGSLVHHANALSTADRNAVFQLRVGLCEIQQALGRIFAAESKADGAFDPVRFNERMWANWHGDDSVVGAAGLSSAAVTLWDGDVFQPPTPTPPGAVRVLVLPTNTELDASAPIVAEATRRLGADVLPDRSAGTAELGSVIQRRAGAGGFSSVVHLVCRRPGASRPVELGSCLAAAAGCVAYHGGEPSCITRYGEHPVLLRLHIPLFGVAEDLALWVRAIAQFLAAPRNSQWEPLELALVAADDKRAMIRDLKRDLSLLGVRTGGSV